MAVFLESLFNHAKAGNSAARSIFQCTRRYLAVGLSTVVKIFDPSLIILSGERISYDYLYANETMNELTNLITIAGRGMTVIAINTWGDLLWAHGAAALALAHVSENCLSFSRTVAAQ
jgi:predicted NBD/HSP70 family sugar kinase